MAARDARAEGRIDVDEVDRGLGHEREQVAGVRVRQDVGESAGAAYGRSEAGAGGPSCISARSSAGTA